MMSPGRRVSSSSWNASYSYTTTTSTHDRIRGKRQELRAQESENRGVKWNIKEVKYIYRKYGMVRVISGCVKGNKWDKRETKRYIH